ncbi:dTDP-4-dehydrorhamnose reductase [Sphingobacterium hungaricum]|uniref:dTDP-4-dehydrorhamnose reductase n=1 Tax=Sphingobacterium hungaricum TaxID=2082723 RepID=A0A928V0C1_9SPHI|nr:dTDP-4-dehydrorhamnose reductase [Sphingobacterium hungaricum]MBE8714137.1 dTDP-4-dehydrorhamnose reductase [Sphingobacterium hungaricum]
MSPSSKKTVLVTGSTGQLGLELQDVFRNQVQFECFFLDRKQLPLDQINLIHPVLDMYQPDYIIHAGAYTAVDLAESEPLLAEKINHLASDQIAEYCAINDTKLIAISTDYVFNGQSSLPLDEDSATEPLNVYGETKLKGEQAINRLLPDGIIIRTSWVYSKYGKNFVKTMQRLLSERDQIQVISDQIGSPTYAKDLAEAIFQIIDSDKWQGGIYHYSNEGQASWYEFAVTIRDILNLQCQVLAIGSEEYPTAAQRPKYSLLDKTKIKNTFEINIPEWKSSLQKMLNEVSN